MRIIDERHLHVTASPLARMFHPTGYRRAAIGGARTGRAGVFLSLLRGAVLRVRAFQERRAAAEQLAGMSDHELADIGLNRGGLYGALDHGGTSATSVRRRAASEPGW